MNTNPVKRIGRPPKPKVVKNCLQCKIKFEVFPSENRRIYCSRECGSEAKKVDTSKRCEVCDVLFSYRTNEKNRRFCSRECRKNKPSSFHNKQNISRKKPKKCLGCGSDFLVKEYQIESRKYCSNACRRTVPIRICQECSIEYRKSHNAKFCSLVCYLKAHTGKPKVSAFPAYIDRLRNYDAQRRARNKDAAGFFTIEQWLDKLKFWGDRCYLCRISLLNQVAHKEHRTPLIRGGSNWIANIAPACAKCNKRKGSKTETEYKIYKLGLMSNSYE